VTLRAFALLGSGEFEPWTVEMDHWLLNRSGGDGTVLIAPTASAPEGDDVFDRWARKGIAHFAEQRIPAAVLPLKTREDAARPEVLEPLERGSLVYFSGGNPWYLAETLRETPAWSTIAGRIEHGLALAGCSAGVTFLADVTFDSSEDQPDRVFKPGVGYALPGVVFGPHWNRVDAWLPGARDAIAATVPAGGVLVAIEEDTALVGDGSDWSVVGRRDVHVLRDGTWRRAGAGDLLDVDLFPPRAGG
jgi:cyanophycinase